MGSRQKPKTRAHGAIRRTKKKADEGPHSFFRKTEVERAFRLVCRWCIVPPGTDTLIGRRPAEQRPDGSTNPDEPDVRVRRRQAARSTGCFQGLCNYGEDIGIRKPKCQHP